METDYNTFQSAISHTKEAISVVSDAKNKPWNQNLSTGIRAVFGHWLAKSTRHLASIIILCESHGLSTVASVHMRQIFEIYLQAIYFASHDRTNQDYLAEKMSAIGYIDFLDKLEIVKNHKGVQKGYAEACDRLAHHKEEIVKEIKSKRKKHIYNWFEKTFSSLATEVSKDEEDLKKVYQILSSEAHGTWSFAFDVTNPQPGELDFRGYVDQNDLYRRAADDLEQTTNYYVNLWNVIAESVGAPKVFFAENQDRYVYQ